MRFDGQADRKGGRSGVERRPPRRRSRNVAVTGVAVALLTPLSLALSPSGPAAASSNVDPNGVLKYGFDLNNEFSNDFAPATEENDCSYTVTSNIYQSMTTPGNTRRRRWRGPELDRLQQRFHHHLSHPAGHPILERPAGDVVPTWRPASTTPRPARCGRRLFAISSIQTPDPSTVVVNLSKPTAGDFLWAMTYVDGQIYPANAISDPIDPAGGGRSLPPEELPAGLVDRARQEPQVLGLEGLSARWHRLHPGDAGARGGDGAHLGRGRHDSRSSRRTTRS